jgi:hypothetical protein
MKQLFLMLAIASLTAGCAPDFLRPTIPALPPEKPDETKNVAARSRGPVTPAQVTDQNARQKMIDLESEMEADARIPTAKP